MTTSSGEFLELQAALKGRFFLERELGRGGMGVVYLAHEVALDRPVALKLLPTDLAADDALRERFLREARTAARLSHPNIVPIFAVDEVDRFVFFAMAYVEGCTLGERVREQGPLGHTAATRMLREVAWALAYAHAQGIVHRDVKPDNILLEEGSGRALVTDFGIAAVGADEPVEGAAVMGTAEFMSPEQARGRAVDARSDIYALGAVGYYAVSGRLPFRGETASEVLAKHLSTPAPPVASVAPDLPTRLASPIDRCLRKDPAERWQGGEDLAAALEEGRAVDRPLPVPLRVFLKRVRQMGRSIPGGLAILAFSSPTLILLAQTLGDLAAVVLLLAVIALTVFGVVGGALAYQSRKLLKAGYRVEDALHALDQDVERRNEELTFEYGEGYGLYDRLLKTGAGGGLGIALVALITMLVGGPEAASIVFALSFGVGSISGLLAVGRALRRRDVTGEMWRKILSTGVGRRTFDAGGLFLKAPASAGSATFRPTEMAIGMAADRLFEDLSREDRRSLRGLPDTVRKLEADARAMRKQVAELDAVLAEIGDDPAGPGAEERARVRAGVQGTRDEAQKRLGEAVTALETIRLGLLRMHAGDGTVESVTMELEAARDISDGIEHLLDGRKEVEGMLRDGRAEAGPAVPGSDTPPLAGAGELGV